MSFGGDRQNFFIPLFVCGKSIRVHSSREHSLRENGLQLKGNRILHYIGMAVTAPGSELYRALGRLKKRPDIVRAALLVIVLALLTLLLWLLRGNLAELLIGGGLLAVAFFYLYFLMLKSTDRVIGFMESCLRPFEEAFRRHARAVYGKRRDRAAHTQQTDHAGCAGSAGQAYRADSMNSRTEKTDGTGSAKSRAGRAGSEDQAFNTGNFTGNGSEQKSGRRDRRPDETETGKAQSCDHGGSAAAKAGAGTDTGRQQSKQSGSRQSTQQSQYRGDRQERDRRDRGQNENRSKASAHRREQQRGSGKSGAGSDSYHDPGRGSAVRNGSAQLEEAQLIYAVRMPYTTDEIKQKRNILLKKYHPDNAEGSEEMCKKINECYRILCRYAS